MPRVGSSLGCRLRQCTGGRPLHHVSSSGPLQKADHTYLWRAGACNHALGRLALAYSDYDSAFGEAVTQQVPQETLNFRAVAYYQGEICVYLNSKIDADVLHFSIDRDLDPEFKECWAKQMLPTPKLLARCPRQLKRGQKFPPSRKDPPLPTDAVLASLLPIADHIGHCLQYSHQGAVAMPCSSCCVVLNSFRRLLCCVCSACTVPTDWSTPAKAAGECWERMWTGEILRFWV